MVPGKLDAGIRTQLNQDLRLKSLTSLGPIRDHRNPPPRRVPPRRIQVVCILLCRLELFQSFSQFGVFAFETSNALVPFENLLNQSVIRFENNAHWFIVVVVFDFHVQIHALGSGGSTGR